MPSNRTDNRPRYITIETRRIYETSRRAGYSNWHRWPAIGHNGVSRSTEFRRSIDQGRTELDSLDRPVSQAHEYSTRPRIKKSDAQNFRPLYNRLGGVIATAQEAIAAHSQSLRKTRFTRSFVAQSQPQDNCRRASGGRGLVQILVEQAAGRATDITSVAHWQNPRAPSDRVSIASVARDIYEDRRTVIPGDDQSKAGRNSPGVASGGASGADPSQAASEAIGRATGVEVLPHAGAYLPDVASLLAGELAACRADRAGRVVADGAGHVLDLRISNSGACFVRCGYELTDDAECLASEGNAEPRWRDAQRAGVADLHAAKAEVGQAHADQRPVNGALAGGHRSDPQATPAWRGSCWAFISVASGPAGFLSDLVRDPGRSGNQFQGRRAVSGEASSQIGRDLSGTSSQRIGGSGGWMERTRYGLQGHVGSLSGRRTDVGRTIVVLPRAGMFRRDTTGPAAPTFLGFVATFFGHCYLSVVGVTVRSRVGWGDRLAIVSFGIISKGVVGDRK